MIYKIVLLAGVFSGICLSASTNQELFLRANSFYKLGQYQQALDAYQSISNKTSVVWYDIGLCFYRLGKLGHALWSFKHASRRATQKDFDTIVAATDHIEKQLGRPSDNSIKRVIYRYMQRATVGTSLLQWQLLLLFFVYALSGILMLVSRRKVLIFMLTAVLLCAVVISSSVCMFKWIEKSSNMAIVAVQRVEIFSGPYQDCHTQGTLDYAQEVVILEGYNDWCKIKSGTIIGWVAKKSIMPIA